MAILELLAAHPTERFTLSEVARRCSLNKATAHALLAALTGRGILLRHPDEKRYSLGPRLVAIGEAARLGYTAPDFVPAALDRLSTDTGRWARAVVRRDDQLVVIAQSRVPPDVDPREPLALPLIPPLGATWMAWSDRLSVEAWLARAATAEAVSPCLAALSMLRRDGYAVALASREWRDLSRPARTGRSTRPAASRSVDHRPDPDEIRALLATVDGRRLLLTGVDDAASYRIADVAAPVFDASGAVTLVLALSGLDDRDLSAAEVRELGSQVSAAADALTADVHGRRPERPYREGA